FFFFYLSSTTVFYILSLHDALPISLAKQAPFLLLLLMVVSGQGLLAADLQALPEFLRSDPFGTIVAPDRSSVDLASSLYDAQHRVMLTGCRGGYVSFQMVVKLPSPGLYTLDVTIPDPAN